MTFSQTVRNSIYNPSFYRAVREKPLRAAFRYYGLLALLLTLLTALLTLPGLLRFQNEIRLFARDASDSYPQELVIRVHQGLVTSNAKEPLRIPVPASWQDPKRLPDNLLVLDTKTPFTTKQFTAYDTVFWVTKDAVFYRGGTNHEIRSFALSDVKDLTINKAAVQAFRQKTALLLGFIAPVLFLMLILGMGLLYSIRLLYYVLLASLVLLLGSFWKQLFTLKDAYKVVIHASTLGLIAEVVINLFSPGRAIPFLFTALTLGVLSCNLFIPPQQNTPDP